LHDSGDGEEILHDVCEILHSRPDYDRLSSEDGFNGILATTPVKALSDYDDFGEMKPGSELASCIRDPNFLARHGTLLGVGRNPLWSGPEDGSKPGLFQLRSDRGTALGVPGHEHEFEIGDFRPERLRDLGDQEFLSVMGAPAEEDPSPIRHTGLGEPLIQLCTLLFDQSAVSDMVKFHTTGYDDVFPPDTEATPAVPVDLEGYGRTIEKRKDRFDERPELEISFLRSGREAGIDEQDWCSAIFQLSHQVRPDLGFDEDHARGADEPDDSRGNPRQINGIVNHREKVRLLFYSDSVTGRGRGAEDDVLPGCGGPDGFDQLEGDEDFADADGVDPDRLPIPKAGERLGREIPQSLPEITSQASPSDPFDQKSGQPEKEDDGEEQIVYQRNE